MTVPEVDPRVLIKSLNKAMAFTLATGAGEDAVLRQFRSAVAVLRTDWEDLKRLIDEYSDAALLEAAELVRIHVDDMRELLDEHQNFIASQREHALFLEVDQEALDLVARLGTLSADVIQAISARADDRMRAGVRVDRSDVREFLTETDTADLAALMDGIAAGAPFIIALNTETLFQALDACSSRVQPSAEVPPPVAPRRIAPERQPDAAQRVCAELAALAAPTTVADFTVRATGRTSVGRHSAMLDAYSRFADLPDSQPISRGVEEPRRGQVWRVSRDDRSRAGT